MKLFGSMLAVASACVVVFFVALFFSGSVIAQSDDPQSANFMMRGCRNFASEGGDGGFLGGWCAGIIDGLHYVDDRKSSCVPPTVTLSQAVRVH